MYVDDICSLLLEVTPFPSPKGKGGKRRLNSMDRAVQGAKKGPRTEIATWIPLVNARARS